MKVSAGSMCLAAQCPIKEIEGSLGLEAVAWIFFSFFLLLVIKVQKLPNFRRFKLFQTKIRVGMDGWMLSDYERVKWAVKTLKSFDFFNPQFMSHFLWCH